MRWLQITLYAIGGLMLAATTGWLVTRLADLPRANLACGRLLLWDLYAASALLGYFGVVGTWHLWERLSGRMQERDDGASNR